MSKALTIDDLKFELELKGWTFGETHHHGKAYPYFTIGEIEDLSYCPLFTFYYTEAREYAEWRLRRGISQWAIVSFDDPLQPEDVESLFRLCSRYADISV